GVGGGGGEGEVEGGGWRERGGGWRGETLAGARMRDAERMEARDRRNDVGVAVMDVIGDADRLDPAVLERRAADNRIGEEAFVADRMPRRPRKATFEIAEHHVGLAQLRADACERPLRIRDIHQLDVAA